MDFKKITSPQIKNNPIFNWKITDIIESNPVLDAKPQITFVLRFGPQIITTTEDIKAPCVLK